MKKLNNADLLMRATRKAAAIARKHLNSTSIIWTKFFAKSAFVGLLLLQTSALFSQVLADPCTLNPRKVAVINLTASGQLATALPNQVMYVCYLQFSLSAVADNVALVEGSGSVCATNTVGMAGGNTAALGWNLLANGGVTSGGITSWAFKTATLGNNVCLLASSAAQISGVMIFVQQ